MAVEAQYPSNAFRTRNGVFEDQSANLLPRAYTNLVVQPPPIVNGAVFSKPESDLSCNTSGSRKRNRDDTMLLMPQQQQILGLIDLSSDYIQPMESASAASTSRRSAPFVSPSPLTPDLISCFHGQGFELDALIRLQKEKIRLGMEEAKKRHFVSLLSSLEITVLKSLKEKETELVNLRRMNAGLEEIVKEMMAENQIWSQVAKNNEAIVSDLRMSLERILSRDSGATEEGYGDSDAVAVVADDARSFCYEAFCYEAEGTFTARKNGELRLRRTCKACRGKDVSVLLLPCRHLCLCKECEWSVGFCPVCKSKKNASLQIFM